MERALSHSLASCSGLARPARGLQRLAAAPAAVRRPRAAAPRAVAGLSRESLMQQPNLNAPSDEELGSPVVAVHSPEEFEDKLAANKDKMVVLMCKATHCRPCKLFSKTYAAAARQYKDGLFMEIMGDESKATRQMMINWKVKVTPTFIIFRNGEKVHQHGGINETNMHRSIAKYLQEGEAGFGSFVEPELGQ
ncbi:Thioredoxin H2-2 [Chlorella sorokiniana]|uniref:Thioredoxin H2-2 n=1 Tax=Chlorella sorokiniana TaxID=3076 RepID=A0A2P6TCI3_CHLSO|nr:Thioredoxin H2-2 [Chlorella sorokiniana]|eukprot:PRW20350.1 Thioredoxin H2-2 [Chlorella sorokiniana]